MSEQSFQERSEKPTAKKRSEARKKGNVAKSREAASVAVLFAGMATLSVFGSFMYNHLKTVMEKGFVMVENPDVDLLGLMDLCRDMVLRFIVILLPTMAAVVVVSVLANVMQTGIMFTWEPLAPKMSKINPMKGLARLVSKQAFMEAFKSLAKLAIVGCVAYWTVKGEMDRLLTLGGLEVSSVGLYIFKIVLKIFFRVGLAMILLAVIDYAFQKWQYEDKLRMTKQEVKEEFKRTEGDPLVKSRIRRVQQELARRRMMQEVPRADVVVTNPVHLAVAIRYDRASMRAPEVVAKGAELVAERIKALAKEHGVPILENKALARDLYKNVDIGGEIPSDFYQAVAEVLAYVYRLKGKKA